MRNVTVKYNFQLDKGSDYTFKAKFLDGSNTFINLNGFDAWMQIRKGYTNTLVDELSLENERLVISYLDEYNVYNIVEFKFPHEATEKYPVGMLLYDLKVKSPSGDITKILEGQIQCLTSVTL